MFFFQNEYITVREFEQRLEALERSMKRSNSEIVKALKKHDVIDRTSRSVSRLSTDRLNTEHPVHDPAYSSLIQPIVEE